MSDCTNCGEYCGHSHGPIDAEEAATTYVAIADALVRVFGRVDPDDVEFGSRTWDRGPLGDSVMARVEARLRKKPGDE